MPPVVCSHRDLQWDQRIWVLLLSEVLWRTYRRGHKTRWSSRNTSNLIQSPSFSLSKLHIQRMLKTILEHTKTILSLRRIYFIQFNSYIQILSGIQQLKCLNDIFIYIYIGTSIKRTSACASGQKFWNITISFENIETFLKVYHPKKIKMSIRLDL